MGCCHSKCFGLGLKSQQQAEDEDTAPRVVIRSIVSESQDASASGSTLWNNRTSLENENCSVEITNIPDGRSGMPMGQLRVTPLGNVEPVPGVVVAPATESTASAVSDSSLQGLAPESTDPSIGLPTGLALSDSQLSLDHVPSDVVALRTNSKYGGSHAISDSMRVECGSKIVVGPIPAVVCPGEEKSLADSKGEEEEANELKGSKVRIKVTPSSSLELDPEEEEDRKQICDRLIVPGQEASPKTESEEQQSEETQESDDELRQAKPMIQISQPLEDIAEETSSVVSGKDTENVTGEVNLGYTSTLDDAEASEASSSGRSSPPSPPIADLDLASEKRKQFVMTSRTPQNHPDITIEVNSREEDKDVEKVEEETLMRSPFVSQDLKQQIIAVINTSLGDNDENEELQGQACEPVSAAPQLNPSHLDAATKDCTFTAELHGDVCIKRSSFHTELSLETNDRED